ncbi:MAG TPA: helix-turn-helix transcriptional regulator [Blastocatellia bacterium]|nr:helix-turn-helix transcriptional regulator [Blastocatellia bacterium]
MKISTLHSDTPLGSWTYCEWRPPHLAGLVEVIWYFNGPTSSILKRILPNGMVEMLVNFGEPYRTIAGAGPALLVTAWMAGLQSGPMVGEQPARQDVMGVRFHPAGAYGLLAEPMLEISDLVVNLEDLVGRSAGELAERCYTAASVEERLQRAANWVAARVTKARRIDPAIAWASGQIERSGGAVSITELREQTGLSKTRLAEAFREQIGLAPKLYARVVRFRRAAAMLQKGAEPLVEVALAAGYYDQPHMNAEFRELSGLSPREFLAARYPTGDGNTVGDSYLERGKSAAASQSRL